MTFQKPVGLAYYQITTDLGNPIITSNTDNIYASVDDQVLVGQTITFTCEFIMSPTTDSGRVGGEKSHTLTVSEIPAHSHFINGGQLMVPQGNYNGALYYLPNSTKYSTSECGGNLPHNNLQPYITCYMWKRIS